MLMRNLATAAAGALLLGAAAFAPAPAAAQDDTWTFDKTHADVVFRIDHLGYSNTWGRFGDVDGVIVFDGENAANASVEATMAAMSIDTNLDKRDEHLRSGDFFKVEEFPEVTFKSTAIEVTGENTANITGDLTMLGVTKPVVLAATLNKAAPHPRDPNLLVAGFTATTSIMRSDWGMSYGVPAIGDQVDIFLDVEATRPAN